MIDVFSLCVGTRVEARRLLDPKAAYVVQGTKGTVVLETEDVGSSRYGPLVKWDTGAYCNVYPGDIEEVDEEVDMEPRDVQVVMRLSVLGVTNKQIEDEVARWLNSVAWVDAGAVNIDPHTRQIKRGSRDTV